MEGDEWRAIRGDVFGGVLRGGTDVAGCLLGAVVIAFLFFSLLGTCSVLFFGG